MGKWSRDRCVINIIISHPTNAHLTNQTPNGYGGYYVAHGER